MASTFDDRQFTVLTEAPVDIPARIVMTYYAGVCSRCPTPAHNVIYRLSQSNSPPDSSRIISSLRKNPENFLDKFSGFTREVIDLEEKQN